MTVSSAFEAYFAHGSSQAKSEAIVVYRTPERSDGAVDGRLEELSMRLDYAKKRAHIQKPVGEKLVNEYKNASAKRISSKRPLSGMTIGDGTLPVAVVEVTRSTLPLLADHPEVAAVMPNQKIRLIEPRAAGYSNLGKQEAKDRLTWGLKRLNISALWEITKGEGSKVAVLDTGVYSQHSALHDCVEDFIVVDPLGRRVSASPMFDSEQHGTHVCGTIAGGKTPEGVSIGVAPDARLLVANVLMGQTTLHTLLEGISWAVEKGANIINMSLGFTYYEPLFCHVFDMLIDEFSIAPIVAIGNENHGNTSSPGNARSAVGVGAVGKAGRGLDVAFFSSGASLVFPGETDPMVTKPDIVAPGVRVYSCIPPQKQPDGTFEYAYMDGTSMAAPHVSGVMALLMAAKPAAHVTDIITALKETAIHPKGGGRQFRPDNRWGYGFIRPAEAMKALD